MKRILSATKSVIKKILVEFSSLLPIRKTVIVESFLGNKNDDNITCLLKSSDTLDYNVLYVQKNKNNSVIPKGKRIIKNSIHYYIAMNTATYIITNSRVHSSLGRKRKGQNVIQMWHGVPWKNLAHDQKNIHFGSQTKEEYLSRFDADVDLWDYLWVPNKYAEVKFKSAFKYHGEMIKHMYPADTQLLEDNKKQIITNLKTKLNIPLNKQIVLYMPTFREEKQIRSGVYEDIQTLDIEKLQESKDFYLITRGHYLTNRVASEQVNTWDATSHESVNELYLLSDILITDYSSAIYSFSLLRKPIISFQNDLEEYREIRGLYPDAIAGMNITTATTYEDIKSLDFDNLEESNPQADYYDNCDEHILKELLK